MTDRTTRLDAAVSALLLALDESGRVEASDSRVQAVRVARALPKGEAPTVATCRCGHGKSEHRGNCTVEYGRGECPCDGFWPAPSSVTTPAPVRTCGDNNGEHVCNQRPGHENAHVFSLPNGAIRAVWPDDHPAVTTPGTSWRDNGEGFEAVDLEEVKGGRP